jgi:type IV pilus assembly protein PilF
MSARKADRGSCAPGLRGALGWVLAVALAIAVTGCESHKRAEKRKDDASDYNMALGIAYLNQGDVPLAKEKLDRALKENPNNAKVHSARAMLFDRMGQPSQADSEFQAALRLSPNDPDVSNNYAVYLCQVGKTDEGVKRFELTARNALYRTPWIAFTNAGVCLRTAKRNADAARNFKQALQLRPNFAEAAFQLGDLEFGDGNLVDARKQVDTYLNAFEETPDLLLLGVRIARAQNDRVAAVVYGRRLRLDFPNSAQMKALAEIEHNPG